MSTPRANFAKRGRGTPPELSGQRGITLIEIMVGVVLTAILVLGMSGLWANVNRNFLSLTLRQKAVFVLNGEMERLAALYRFTGFAGEDATTDGYASTPNERLVFPSSLTAVNQVVTSVGSDFTCDDNTCAGLVFFDANGVSANDDRNYVWLDQARDLTAQLSWRLRELTDTPLGNAGFPVANAVACSDGITEGDGTLESVGSTSVCQELTVYIEFPFRYASATEPGSDANIGKPETMSLITIVGRR